MEYSFNNCCSGIVLCYDDLAIYYYFVFIYYDIVIKFNNYSKNSHSLEYWDYNENYCSINQNIRISDSV